MNIIEKILNKIFIFDKEPQKIGISQLNKMEEIKPKDISIRNKDIKLSDLMRRAS